MAVDDHVSTFIVSMAEERYRYDLVGGIGVAVFDPQHFTELLLRELDHERDAGRSVKLVQGEPPLPDYLLPLEYL